MARKPRRSKKKWNKRGVSANAQQQKNRGSQYGYLSLPKGISVFKEKEHKRVMLDFIPYVVSDKKHPDRNDEYEVAIPGELWYKRPFKIHRNIGADNETVICLASVGLKCPICEHRAKRAKEGAEKEELKALKASDRNLYIVIPKENKTLEEEPFLWDISQFLFQEKLNEEIEEDDDYACFPDLEEGLSLRIRFSMEKIGKNEFAETSRIDFKEREGSYDESILDDVPNLDEIIKNSVKSYAELEKIFFEIEDEEPEPEDTERTHSSRHRSHPIEEPEEGELELCVACEGSGTNTKGRTCRICKGTGEKPREKEEDDEEKPSGRSQQSRRSTKSKCPHGHKFGDDCEEYDECDDCKKWDDCIDAKEAGE